MPGPLIGLVVIFIAMSFLSLAPVIGFFIAGQKYLVKGIATTGLK